MSPYGLALSEEYLWNLSPFEYSLLRREFERSRKHTETLVATVQLTLHRAFLQKRGGGTWSPEDFGLQAKAPAIKLEQPPDFWRVQKLQMQGLKELAKRNPKGEQKVQ